MDNEEKEDDGPNEIKGPMKGWGLGMLPPLGEGATMRKAPQLC
jgi:hypothetical protein